jgi:dolichyl-diphosphooligosaccharide--protein glycosyltransferase
MPSPEETTARTREYLADHPEAEDALGALLERDADGDPWTFAETDLDSGQFGELVSRDLATAVDDGYRLQQPVAIRAALDGSEIGESTEANNPATTGSTAAKGITLSEKLSDRLAANFQTRLAVVGALLTVVAARLVAAPAVLRDGYVVSPANDTYFFRYWQERLAARADGVFDLALFADMGGAASTRPLSHAINWWVTVLLGGVDAAPLVAAWLPIVTAVCLGYVVYRLTYLLTSDVRVALAAVLFYGLAPVNVVYTTVGFLDHQAHQYLWLGLLVFALTTLATDVARRARETDPASAARAHARAPRSWGTAAGLAVAVAASAHLWGGSPLTFIPVAAVVGFRVALDIRHDGSPAVGNAPLLVGLTVGAGLALAAHLGLGWHESIAAVTPVLVAGGAVAVVAAGELWRRTNLPATGFVVIEAIVAGGGLFAYWRLRPAEIERFRIRAEDLFFREGATETASLFSPDFAVVFSPLIQLGLGFYFGIAVLGVATWVVARRYEPGWLVPVCFAWYYTLLATIQVRFAGQLAIFIAPFAGIGLVYLLAAIDIARPVDVLGPASRTGDTAGSFYSEWDGGTSDDEDSSIFDRIGDAETTPGITSVQLPDGIRLRGILVAAVALVLVFNLILIPPLVGQTTYDRAQFEAAQTIEGHADAVDREYPQNFVLSLWGDNRMYNYFVSGESQSYGYAQSYHDQFLVSAEPDDSYDRFQDRVGYVVVTDRENMPATNTTYATLYGGMGLGANDTASTGHYQLLASDDGVRTFAVVPGATIQVTDPAAVGATGGEVTATAEVEINEAGTNVTHEYARSATVADATATVRVAYPGEYQVGNRTIIVTDDDVLAGNQTTIPSA